MLSEGIQTGRGRRAAYLHRDRVHGIAAGPAERPARRADVGRRHPGDGRLPRRRRPGRHHGRHRQRGLGHREHAGRRVPPRQHVLADPPRRGRASCGWSTPRARRPPSPSGSARRRRAPRSRRPRCPRCARRSTSSSRRPTSRRAADWLARRGRRRHRVATEVVRYLAAARAALGVLPTQRRRRLRALLRRGGRHAARRPRALRRPDQPRPRPRAPEALLPALRLRAPGGGQRRRGRALPRPRAKLPARRRAAVPDPRERRGGPRPGAAPVADVPGAMALEPRPRARGAAAARRAADAAADPAHGGGRPHGRGVPRARRLPGERGRRAHRDPGPPDRAPDDARLPARGDRRGRARPPLRRLPERGRGAHLPRDDRALAARPRDPERPPLHLPRRRAARGAADAGRARSGGVCRRPRGISRSSTRTRSRGSARRRAPDCRERRGAPRPPARAGRPPSRAALGGLVPGARRGRARRDGRSRRQARSGSPRSSGRA